MAGGLNTTGTPNTADYLLGRGTIYVSELTAGRPGAGGWRNLGNAPEMNIAVEVETLEHQSSLEGLATIDKEVVISQKVTISFQLDETNFQNMALFLSGAAVAEPDVNPAVAGYGPIEVTDSAVLGVWYDLHVGAGRTGIRAYDIDATKLTLNESSGAPVLLTEGTDYTVDEKNGRVFILSTAADLAAGEPFTATLTADAGAEAPDEVRALTQTNVLVALKFISKNPANSDQEVEYQFHQINLKPEGDFGGITDDFSVMGFSGVAETQALGDPNSPTLTIRKHLNS